MQQFFRISVSKLIAAFALAAPLSIAYAHSGVNLSVNLGAPAPVYAPPPVVYVQPQPVYVQPQPVYVQPAAVVAYQQPYVVGSVGYRNWQHGYWRHHHHHH